MAEQRWEYRQVDTDWPMVVSHLNALGSEGWELVHAESLIRNWQQGDPIGNASSFIRSTFKRPLAAGDALHG